MPKSKLIQVKSIDIRLVLIDEQDYISLTDMTRFKNETRTEIIIQNWLKNRNTLEFVGLWESIHNPDFKHIEFDVFKKEAGFGITAAEWRTQYPKLDGNIRDHAQLEQLIVLRNIEAINAVLIVDGLDSQTRLQKLNQTAISQMKSLFQAKQKFSSRVKKIKDDG